MFFTLSKTQAKARFNRQPADSLLHSFSPSETIVTILGISVMPIIMQSTSVHTYASNKNANREICTIKQAKKLLKILVMVKLLANLLKI